MTNSVRFYRDVLRMEIIYGGEVGYFSSLRTEDGNGPILNLEQGRLGAWLGADDLLHCGRGCDLGIPVGKRISSRESAGRFMG